jgi:hypothetical protein
VKRKLTLQGKGKKKSYTEVSKVCNKNESSLCELVKTKKEIHASFVVTHQTVKAVVTVPDECLVKMEKVLNLWVQPCVYAYIGNNTVSGHPVGILENIHCG